MRTLGRLKETVGLWRDLASQATTLLELTDLAQEDGDDALLEQISADAGQLSKTLAREEIALTLAGPYDDRPAIVSVYSGAGGTDSQDWAEMLLKMYARWGEVQRRPVQVMDLAYGDEAGLRSATLEVGGPTPTATSARNGASTAWCASLPTTPTTCATPPLPRLRCCRPPARKRKSSSARKKSRWTPSAPAAPADRMSRR